MDTEPNQTRPRDVSFSSYHRMVGENFILNLPEPIYKPIPVTAQTPSRSRAAKATEGELGVFAAERYYNATVEDIKAGHESPRIATNTGYVKQKSRKQSLNLGTPSINSEASSSWNSHSALLSIKRSKKASRSSFFSGLNCSGRSCSDKNSVTIGHPMPPDEQQRKPIKKSELLQIDPKLVVFDGTKQSLPRYLVQLKDDHVLPRSPMSITSSSNNLESNFRRSQLALGEEIRIKDEEDPRVSLEVFGSVNLKKGTGEISMNLERKLSMLTWDAIPKTQSTTTMTTINGEGKMACHDEIESDASSDLFEIENISSHNGSFQQQQTPRFAHMASSCMTTPTSVYEPSEASIEWSVITASAADFSVNQDYNEKKVEMPQKISSKNLGKSGQRTRPGGIMGCKSHKAVSVVEPGPLYMFGGGGNEKDMKSQCHNHLQRQHQKSSNGSGTRSGDFDFA